MAKNLKPCNFIVRTGGEALSSVEATAKALEGVDIQKLAQKVGYAKFEDATKIESQVDFASLPEPTNEQSREARSQMIREQESVPPKFVKYPIGTKSIDRFGEVSELKMLPLNQIISRDEGTQKESTINKYAKWIKEGSQIPPAKGVENFAVEGGKVKLIDGNHRYSALQKIGAKEMPVWVSLTDPNNVARPIYAKNEISSAYHAAKKDGSNPELVNAVEDLLGTGEEKSLSYPEMVEYLASHPELTEEGKAERRKIGGGAKKAKKGQLVLKDGKVITPTSIDGQTIFYHGSTKPRKGRLRANWAEGFGEAVYFGTDRKAIEEDYEEQYTTEAYLNLKKPLYYNSKDWDAVIDKAVELYSRKETPKLLDEYSRIVNGVREWYSEDAQAEYESKGYLEPPSAENWVKEEDATWINKAAQELGYDAIIAPHYSFGNEIAVLDENAVIYPEEIETVGGKEDKVEKFLKDLYWKEGGLGMNAGLWNAAVTTMIKAYKTGKTVYEAIQAGIKFLTDQGENIKDYQNVINQATEYLKAKAKSDGREIGTPPSEEAPEAPAAPKAEGGPEGEPEGTETRERKTITSIKGLEDISDSVKEALFGETTRYTVLPNQVSLNEANAILKAMGDEKAKALVLDGDENIPDAFRVTLGEVLIKKFNSEGRYNDAVDVATGIAKEATGWGQAIQALSLIKFLTPEGQLLAATRAINALRDKRFKAEEGKMNRVKKAFKKADDEAIEGAINAVVTQTEETPAPQATRAKTWGEKNKIVTKAVYEAAKKALKKFAFTGVPPELITIAAYHVEAGARSFADFSKEMVKDFGRKVRPYLKAAYKAAQKKVGGSGYSTDTEIAQHLSAGLDRDIKDVMKESGIQIRDLIRQHYSEAERTKEALTKALVDKLGLSDSDASIIAAKVDAEYNRLATDKKERALKAIEKRLVKKAPVRKTAEQKLIELSNLGALDEKTFKEEYARAMGFPEITKENAAKIKELAEKVQNAKEGRPKFNAIINLLNYQATLPGVDKMDLRTSIWMASLLSGPTTQLKNIFANSYNMGALAFNVAMQSPKDIPFLLRGLTIGLGNGLQEGGSTMITGQSPIKQAAAAQGILERTKFSPYNPFGYYKYVPRFMLAADAVTYGGLKEMRAYQLALSEARDKYPTQNAYQKAIEILAQTDAQLQSAQAEAKQEYQEALAEIDADTSLSKIQKEAKKAAAKLDRSRRVYDIVEQNRPNQLVRDAHDFALRGTFNNPPDGALGMAARFFNGITHKVPAVRFFVPFVNVITNVANEYVNYSPIGYARAMKGGSITGNKKTFTEQDRKELMIKATIGTASAIAAFVLSGLGGDDDEEEPFFQITADGYNDYKKNKELELTGWMPYSIKIGNTWVSYKLTPMAAILASVGALRDRERYGKEKITENALNKAVIPFQEFMSTVAETSFLGSAETFLSGVLGATKGDKGQKLVEWASKTGGAFVPVLGTNLYQQIAERVYDALDMPDKEYRGVDGAIGVFAKMLRNIPVVRDEFQNAVNGLGEELPPQTGGVIFSKKEAGPHAKLWQLLADKKATTGRPDRRGATYIDINGDQKAMNDEQFYSFAKTRGEYIRTLMEKQYDRLKDMDDKEFAKWMENARTSANRFANGELALASEKGIYEKGIKKYKAEAEHEKDRLMYAIERGDAKSAKEAFENYEPLSTNSPSKDKKEMFVEIVSDDIMPTGVNISDKIDFYRGVFLNENKPIRVQVKQADGKIKMVSKPFNEIFSASEREEFRRKYEQKEEEITSKLSVLDKALDREYSKKLSGDAIWRKYLKMGATKK